MDRATHPDERGGRKWTRRGGGEDTAIREAAAKVSAKLLRVLWTKAGATKHALGMTLGGWDTPDGLDMILQGR